MNNTPTIININVHSAKKKKLNRVWEMGFNTCHGPVAMRSDLQQQIQRANRELGMKYWRCHGLLHDDVNVVVRNEDNQIDYVFSGLKRILDAGLSMGVKPFMELSFTPAALARDTSKRAGHYRAIVSPPKDFKEWRKLIIRTVQFLTDTYGRKEIRTWFFDLWNEPNIPFWDGTQKEFFELYKETAEAVKSIDAKYRVGGPATARGEWVPEFLKYCRNENVPVDYVSTHIYASDVAFSNKVGGDVNLLGLDYMYKNFLRVKNEVAEAGYDVPIYWAEWNNSAAYRDHDDVNNAAFTCGAIVGMMKYSNGSLYWNLSDIYEEGEFHFTPFHGGWGLYTVDNIPKACARAFEFLYKLLPYEVEVHCDEDFVRRGLIASKDSDSKSVRLVLWNHKEKTSDDVPWDVEIDLGDVSTKHVTISQIIPGKGSAYETWVEMGSPRTPTANQYAQLHRASIPSQTTQKFRKAQTKISLTVAPRSAQLVDIQISK